MAETVNWNEYAADCIELLRGSGRDQAYHSLIEADDAIIPALIDAFRVEPDAVVRSEIVAIVWQHRSPETVQFLSEALNDTAPEVWKQALDGLVTVGGPAAVRVLELARQRLQLDGQKERTRAEWLDEAIHQVRR